MIALTVIYFLLTFVFSWGCFFLAACLLGWPKQIPVGVGTHPLALLGVFGPAIVAIAMSRATRGPDGRNALLRSLTRFPKGAWWYAFALLFLPAIRLLAASIERITGGAWPRGSGESLLLLLAGTLVSWPVQAGEELGWRGYALPLLASRMGLAAASLVVGIVWALWHLPQFILPGTSSSGQSFPVFALSVVALSVVMAWLYGRTRASLPIVMLMHAAVNNLGMIFPSSLASGEKPLALGATRIAWITLGLLWMFALYFLWLMRSATLSRSDK